MLFIRIFFLFISTSEIVFSSFVLFFRICDLSHPPDISRTRQPGDIFYISDPQMPARIWAQRRAGCPKLSPESNFDLCPSKPGPTALWAAILAKIFFFGKTIFLSKKKFFLRWKYKIATKNYFSEKKFFFAKN